MTTKTNFIKCVYTATPVKQAILRNSSLTSDPPPTAQDLNEFQERTFNNLIPLLLWRMRAALQPEMEEDEEATHGIIYFMKGMGALLRVNKEKVMLGKYAQVEEVFEMIMKSLAHNDFGVSSAAVEVSSSGVNTTRGASCHQTCLYNLRTPRYP